jgi:hypothetical protein
MTGNELVQDLSSSKADAKLEDTECLFTPALKTCDGNGYTHWFIESSVQRRQKRAALRLGLRGGARFLLHLLCDMTC